MEKTEPNGAPTSINTKAQGKWIRKWVETLAHTIQQKETKEWLQMLVLDPFLSYIIDRIFPYFLLLIVLFALLLVFVIITCILIIYRFQSFQAAATGVAAAAAVAASR
jgi:hypothetical protein